MCTDLRLIQLPDRRISARTLDFAMEVDSHLEVVPAGQQWSATAHPNAPAMSWTNSLGFVAMDAFGFPGYFCDGLNEAGLSVGTLWLPETNLRTAPDAGTPAVDFINLAGWLLGTCRTVAEVKSELAGANLWNAPLKMLWPTDRGPFPPQFEHLKDWAFTMHLALHDATGADLVVEFVDGMRMHDNPTGVLTNSPPFDWHLTNLRNYVGLTNVESEPYNLAGLQVTATGNGSGLIGLPGDVTPPARFVRATVLTQTCDASLDAGAAVNQAFHVLSLCSVPRQLAASGDYTQWSVARDHDTPTYYVRTYDSWETGVHVVADVLAGGRRQLPLP